MWGLRLSSQTDGIKGRSFYTSVQMSFQKGQEPELSLLYQTHSLVWLYALHSIEYLGFFAIENVILYGTRGAGWCVMFVNTWRQLREGQIITCNFFHFLLLFWKIQQHLLIQTSYNSLPVSPSFHSPPSAGWQSLSTLRSWSRGWNQRGSRKEKWSWTPLRFGLPGKQRDTHAH